MDEERPEPKFKRGEWVISHPSARITKDFTPEPIRAQIADIEWTGSYWRYDLIQPGDPVPLMGAPEENLEITLPPE